ncbi:MAG: helix-turn-helix domain-containing protein [Acidobacteria bacterium]|nr:helix-turn-helix domain-containing protein [Acidobacteriota bacterium]
MGRAKRVMPKQLGEKLYQIRDSLDLTLEGLIERLKCPEIPLYPASISMYESGKREPPLLVLLRYARLGGVTMEMLVDDKIKLSMPRSKLK